MDDFSDRQLRWAYWWAMHRGQFRRVFLGILIAAVAILWVIFFVLLARFLWYEGRFQAAMRDWAKSSVNTSIIQRPLPLTTGRSFLLPIDSGREDRVLEIENTNAKWVARVTYRLGENGAVMEAVVLPEERKLLMQLGARTGASGSTFANPIIAVNWRRIQDYATVRDERLQMRIDNQEFIRASRGSFGVPADRVLFTVTNETAFTYAAPAFIVSLWGQGNLIAVNRVTIDPLRPQETRTVEARWLPPISEATISVQMQIQIDPDIDISDPSAFL